MNGDVEPEPYNTAGCKIWRLAVTNERRNGVLVVAPAGRIGALSAAAFAGALAQAVTSGEHRLVVDFALVDYISGAGLRALDHTATRLEALQREIVVCALCEPVRLAFDLAGFLPRFAIEPSRDTAIARP